MTTGSRTIRTSLSMFASLIVCAAIAAQSPDHLPAVSRVEVPGAALISFQASSATDLVLAGTERAPEAYGKVRVRDRRGTFRVEIERREIAGLNPPWTFGEDYRTFVLWAVLPDESAVNLGELLFDDDHRSRAVEAGTSRQAFWLMITAEPYFSVNEPSPAVVMASQSQTGQDAANKGMEISAAVGYRTRYTGYSTRPGVDPSGTATFYVLQARQALRWAEEGAGDSGPPDPDGVSAEMLKQARRYSRHTEQLSSQEFSLDQIELYARTAVQYGEAARAARLAEAPRGIIRELRERTAAAEAEAARLEGLSTKTQEDLTRAQDKASQLEAALDLERQHTRDTESQLLALREQLSRQDTRLQSVRTTAASVATVEEDLCPYVRAELAAVGGLKSRNGFLVYTLPADSLFESGKYELSAEGHVLLARVASQRRLLFPGAAVRFEGHTDQQGSHEFNQWLSEQRALSVYRFFLQDQLARTDDEAQAGPLQETLEDVGTMLDMSFNAVRNQPQRRREWIESLNGVVLGKGPDDPLADVPGADARNRRVNLILLRDQAGEVAKLCEGLFGAAEEPK